MDKWITALVLAGMLWMAGINLPAVQTEDDAAISVLSYNIHHGTDYRGIHNLENTAGVIQMTGADIIALQEVDKSWDERSRMADQLSWLAAQLGMHSTFGPALQNKTGFYGIGILSKYPIVRSQYYVLPGKLEQRVLLVAEIDVKGKKLYVFNTHLGLSAEDRRRQVAKILEIAHRYENEHIILLGDFNTTGGAPELAPLTGFFHEGTGNIGTGLDETLIGEKRKIDTIFTTAPLHLESMGALLYAASDHFPLWAKLRIP